MRYLRRCYDAPDSLFMVGQLFLKPDSEIGKRASRGKDGSEGAPLLNRISDDRTSQSRASRPITAVMTHSGLMPSHLAR
jgi:hypothetical protein